MCTHELHAQHNIIAKIIVLYNFSYILKFTKCLGKITNTYLDLDCTQFYFNRFRLHVVINLVIISKFNKLKS